MNPINQKINQSFREEAFLSYDAVKSGDKQDVALILEQMGEKLRKSELKALDCAYWLWLMGEYANQSGDRTLINASTALITSCIEIIEKSWNKPDNHWLREEEEGLFLSNLAIYYGALRSVNNMFRSENAQKICKDIREMTFAAFMRENHFISRQGSNEVWEDIVVAAVPFGLVSAGDLAMLDAIERLNEAGMQGDWAALMSWYYSEKGQPARAKQFLEQAAKGADEESVLYIVASSQLTQKALGTLKSDSQTILFKHEPVGGECPYLFGNNERSPRLVTIGSQVTIRTFAEPFRKEMPIWLEYAVDEGVSVKVQMTAEQSTESEPFWQADLTAFSDFASVKYRFVAEGNEQASNWFLFEVLQWMDIHKVIHVNQAEKHVEVFFDSPLPGGRKSMLTVKDNDTNKVNCSFALAKDDLITKTDTAVDGSYLVGNVELRIEDLSLSLQLLNEKDQVVSSSYALNDFPLLQMLTDRTGHVYKLHLNFSLTAEERLFGMGERFARMEFRGHEVDNYVFNQYKDQGFKTYIPVPFMLSTNGYGLFLESSLYSVFRFGTLHSDLLQIEADVHNEHQSLSWYLFTGEPLELVAKFASISGKPKLPPKWAFGPWMSSNNWDSEKEVDWQLAQTKKHAIPSTVMVLEQWSDESTFYIFNDAQYEEKSGEDRFTYDDFTFPVWGRWPNPKKLAERIHDQGIRLLMWQAPVMKFMDGIAHQQRDEDERVMVEKGYGVHNSDGTPYRIPQYEWFRNSMVPDFTNPAGAAWWLSKRQYLLDEIKVDGFKTDGGECIYGSDVQFHDGRKGAEMRNEYPNNYIKAFYDFTNQHVKGGGITFSRAGYTGAQNMPLHWAGDEKSTFDAFRSSIIAGLNCGMSGISFWGWDLGGFSGEIPTAELFIRSAQMAAFCPVMQYHAESKGEFNLDRTPWNIAERTGKDEVLSIYKQYADLRMNMLPYIYEQAQLSANHGHPLMCAMLLAFPNDLYCLELNQQYMFGRNLLVAPIAEEGAVEATVYLPEGSWLSMFNQDKVVGGRAITVQADITQIPVFIKENSVIPLNLNAAFELASEIGNDTDRYEQLCMMVYLTEQLDYSFTDDLGTSIKLTATKSNQTVEASIEVIGDYSTTLIFRALEKVAFLKQNDELLVQTRDSEKLREGYFLTRDNEVMVMVKPGKTTVSIEIIE